MFVWNGEIGPGGIAAIIGAVSGTGSALFLAIRGLGMRDADAKGLVRRFEQSERAIEALEATCQGFVQARDDSRHERADLRQDLDAVSAQVTSLAGLLALHRDQFAEAKLHARETFAARETVVDLERRMSAGTEKVFDKLEAIAERLNVLVAEQAKLTGQVTTLLRGQS